MTRRQRILLLIQAEPGKWPDTVESRVRLAYKSLLRRFGIRIKDHRMTRARRLRELPEPTLATSADVKS